MNKLVMALVRSPLRWLTGPHTAVLCYTGPKSERVIELPVWAMPYEGGWVVAVGGFEAKRWWRAFRGPLAATLQAGNSRRTVIGQLLEGPAHDAALAAYLDRIPLARRGTPPATPVVRLRPMDLAR